MTPTGWRIYYGNILVAIFEDNVLHIVFDPQTQAKFPCKAGEINEKIVFYSPILPNGLTLEEFEVLSQWVPF